MAAEGAFRRAHVELSIEIRKHLSVLTELYTGRPKPGFEDTEHQRLKQMTADGRYMVVLAEQEAAIASARYLPIAGEPSRSVAEAIVDERKDSMKAVDDVASGWSSERVERAVHRAEKLVKSINRV